MRTILLLLAFACANCSAQISAKRYTGPDGIEVIVNRDAPMPESVPAPQGRAPKKDPIQTASLALDPKLRISPAEQDRRDRDRLGILQQELEAESAKLAAAMARAQPTSAKLSAAESQRLTEELYDHQKNIQALNAELRRTRAAQ